ncbi:MAG: ester cyclase [Coxiellaceae bacterium]|nr:ester cyclase [Coxiellaceae bacterium]
MTNKQLIETYFNEAWSKGNLDVLDEIISPHYVNHAAAIENPEPGPAGLKPIIEAMRQGIPDLHYDILNIVDGGDHVAVYTMMKGTHTGDFFGMAPSNQKISVQQMQIERIENGQLVEHWRVTDDLTLLKQIKVLND